MFRRTSLVTNHKSEILSPQVFTHINPVIKNSITLGYLGLPEKLREETYYILLF